MVAKDFIVAIELGSSKMTGIAGKKNLDGSINVLAVVKEDSSSFIHKGVVYNLDKTVQALTTVVARLRQALKTEITQVYVGVGGQSIRSVKNVIPIDLIHDTKVTDSMVAELMDANRNMNYPEQEILDVSVQEYKVDQQLQSDPVGIPCKRLEGNFLNILQRKAFFKNLNDCFSTADIEVAEMYLSPLVLADSVLTEAEKRSGCVLVDLGADTTTVSVYSKNMLRHLAVIPLGGANITKDIASLQIDESDAERMKLKYASALTENNDIDDNATYSIDGERTVASREFIEVVEARMLEIIENVWAQVPADYYDKLLGGIILTGGGSNMKDIEKAFRNHTQLNKIRVAKTVNFVATSSVYDLTENNADMNTILGLLAKGDMNCAGGEAGDTGNLFGNEVKPVNTKKEEPRQVGEAGAGKVVSAAERDALQKKKDEEAAAAAAEAEAAAQAAAEAAAEAAELEERMKAEEKRGEGFMTKMKKFWNTITDAENTEEK